MGAGTPIGLLSFRFQRTINKRFVQPLSIGVVAAAHRMYSDVLLVAYAQPCIYLHAMLLALGTPPNYLCK